MFTTASEEKYKEGQVIFKEKSSGDWVYLVLSGSVEITKTVEGRKFVLGIIRPGDVFGELGFLGGIKRSATAMALEDTMLGTVDRDSLDAEFNKISSDFRSLITTAIVRYEKILDRVCDFTSRTEPRAPKTLSLTYKDKKSFIKAYTGNISNGGLFIKTEKPLPQGEKFLLKLQLPELKEPMKINSEVAWISGSSGTTEKGAPGMGIKFLEMSPSDRETLTRYIQDISTV